MKRIGLDCHKLEDAQGNERAGIGRHVFNLLEEISHRPELAGEYKFYLYFKGRIPEDIPFLKNSIFICQVARLPKFLPFFRPSFNIFFHIALPFFVWRDKVDVTFFAGFMLPAFFIGKSIVLLTNDIYYEYTQGSLPLRYRLGYKLFSNWAAKRATQIVTQTEASREEVSLFFNLPKLEIAVAPLGVNLKDFQPTTTETKENFILYVGQAFPRRHLKETLLAFEALAPLHPNLNFVAIGFDKYNPPIIGYLIRQIEKRIGPNRIAWHPSVSDKQLKNLYQKATLFAYISSSEAMGLPPLEALASGTVPLVADTPTTREIFENSAFFVSNPITPQSIRQALERALAEPQKRTEKLKIGQGRVNYYTWKRHADIMLKLFEKNANA
ncbi:MAG: hypothetical protein COV31_01345 [Candidatus Yanofskybacteria bacterium CG10_big_fil_rev_8_21_14_0_10_46_23]|uniref:Glycosyl transferase family 1 domain-containing protein n=1 Tax=Candidatus Yanofskybacteria bacterium CG10_big_fil_rev_8_21_14_0_10_46_23 TaxID=1975098 RepID=A0A2H0R4P1_9BACT|nr:MAG: hypothetical protein COV31_01345 [Candidatus Yanofskybacteria bacterium CG10_big_fil_rev_8_21_14_0_10_46_23]